MTSDRTSFHFTPLAIAANLALRPVAQPPQAEADTEQSRAAMSQMAQALVVGETEVGEAHEKAEEVVISSASRAVDVPAANDNADPPKDKVSVPTRAGDLTDEQANDFAMRNRRLAVEIGARIRVAREINGISQTDFSHAMGHQKSTQPSLWEAGKRMVPPAEIANVAKVLGVSIDYLFGLSNDLDASPAATRRGLLVQHLRDQVEVFAGHLADAALESGVELEGSLRATQLLARCEAVCVALDRFRAANESRFDDMRGGAWLERTTRELMEAATAVGAELEGVGQRRERAARKAKTAMAAGVR